jgi:hypothetical protein
VVLQACRSRRSRSPGDESDRRPARSIAGIYAAQPARPRRRGEVALTICRTARDPEKIDPR